MTAEYWRPVPGYEGLYEVSDQGRVKRLAVSRIHGRSYKERLLKCCTQANGYKHVVLTNKDQGKKCFLVHRLVALSFVEGDTSLNVNHLDGDRSNNKASNLEWVTQAENVAHACRTGLRKTSVPYELHEQVRKRYVELGGKKYGNRVKLAREFGVSSHNIGRIINRASP